MIKKVILMGLLFNATYPLFAIDPFCVAVNQGNLTVEQHIEVASKLYDAGVRCIRMKALRWADCEFGRLAVGKRSFPTNLYNFGEWADIYNAYASLNFFIVVPIIDTPEWAVIPGQLAHTGAPIISSWKNFIEQVVNTFTDVDAYEIWNEPGNKIFWTGTYQQYRDMYLTAYNVIKNNSSAEVWGPGAMAMWIDYYDEPGSEYLLRPLAGDIPVDVFTYHDYTPRIKNKVSHAETILAHTNKQVAITETNKTWDANWYDNHTDQQLADQLESIYLKLLGAGIKQVYWWKGVDSPGYRNGLLDESINPKKPYYMLKSLIEEFKDED